MSKYAIGVDFGTLSGRAVLLDLKTGEIIAQSVRDYTHGVIDDALPGGKKLGQDWALQHPMDYLEVFYDAIPDIMKKSGVSKTDVIGMSVDFTACTMLPLDKRFMPLCFQERYRDEPHAYVKLWKHHAAQKQANFLNEIARGRGERFLSRYGGKISSEWLIPKIMQILDEAPEIYEQTHTFAEAADWVTFMLCGSFMRNACTAGYKALWHKREGYPAKAFFRALDPRLENLVEEKLSGEIVPTGRRAGFLTRDMAEKLGLHTNVAVAVANVDAHVSLPAAGITETGKLLMIMGTSTCDILLGDQEKTVEGMCGVVEDGVIEGFYGYESGQSCVGDHFDWFVNHCVPPDMFEAAEKAGEDIHGYLTRRASELSPGQSGLIVLDWFNGNRSVLVDADLTGLMLGMTLQTKPEEIYRALIEATAYGKRIIIEAYEKAGVPVLELYACGGISWKNRLMMQIYADVADRPIYISACDQTPALGAAMFGAVAAGKAAGGYDNIVECAKVMGKIKETYYPIPENIRVYEKLYAEYKLLHDWFGRGGNDVMKRLKKIKSEAEHA
ncbi:MAG: ribulokinase [Clostridiales bacterium]|nr:ribulokinase [Clostridiales bacterium]